MERPDTAGGSLALLAGGTILWRSRRGPPALPILVSGLLIHTLSYGCLPELLRALVALMVLGAAVAGWPIRGTALSGFALLLLALPIIPHLNFYAGYPLRVIVGEGVCWMLSTSGIEVNREGVTLTHLGRLVVIDAPCSGVRMLWTGGFLVFSAAGLGRLGARPTTLAAMIAFILVIIGNVMRSGVLFLLESGILHAPKWLHMAVGIAAFGLSGLAILAVVRRLAPSP